MLYGKVCYNESTAFIVKRKNREGNHYVYLVESYRIKDKTHTRTLESYGRLDLMEKNEPGVYERLRKEAQERLIGRIIPKRLAVSYDSEKEISYEIKQYGWKLFESIFEMIRIKESLMDTFDDSNKVSELLELLKLLTYQRVLNPKSKLYTQKTQGDMFGNWKIKENKMYRSLKNLSIAKENIQVKAHEGIRHHIGRQATLVFYDVTNYYFDIDNNDLDTLDEETGEITEGFRKKGPCKAKSGNPIVQLGLFMDTNGIPISYKLFKGNTVDVKTYIPAIEQVKKQFGIKRIIVVADKAMNSKGNVILTSNNKDGWLFSQKHRGKRGANKAIQDFVLDDKNWEFNKQATFAKKSMIHKRQLEKGIEISEKIVVTWNKKYAVREKIRRDGALDYARKLTNPELFRQTAKRGGKKYLKIMYKDKESNELKPFNPLITIDQDKVDFDEHFDGVNVLVTSEIHMSDDDIITHYGSLYKIEDCFRVTKTEFNAKPVYVRLEEHIEAHFLTCFLSLIIIRVLQHKTNWQFSARKLIKAINSARAIELTKGFYKVTANEDLKELFKMLDIDFNKEIVRHEDLKNFNKSWCTTK